MQFVENQPVFSGSEKVPEAQKVSESFPEPEARLEPSFCGTYLRPDYEGITKSQERIGELMIRTYEVNLNLVHIPYSITSPSG